MFNNIKTILEEYLQKFPEDNKTLTLLKRQLNEEENIFDRKNLTGHIVANALIINKDTVLTVFHNQLKMYLQPGGHVENTDLSVLDASIRESGEETGLTNMILHKWHQKGNMPVLIETHLIPENAKKQEKEHYHHDFMYVFTTKVDEINLQLAEVSDFEWVSIENVLGYNSESFIGKSLKRIFS